MTYGHLRADCLYTGISSEPNARYRVWESLYTIIMQCSMVCNSCKYDRISPFLCDLHWSHTSQDVCMFLSIS